MPKDSLSANPVLAARKAEKAKALKKGKAQVQTQRNERLARRNPERIQRQIDDLKEREERGGLKPSERQELDKLEKDLKGVQKAREALGDKAPSFGREGRGDRVDRVGRGGGGRGRGGRDGVTGANGVVLGKRRRDFGGRSGSESSETDEDVRDIPMPEGTPPPLPRRKREQPHNEARAEGEERTGPHALPAKPEVVAPSKTVYSSAPVIRDLRKEAVSKFVPSNVKVRPKAKEALKEEAKEDAAKAVGAAVEEAEYKMMSAVPSRAGAGGLPLDEEQAMLERELRQVEMEEVEDEDV